MPLNKLVPWRRRRDGGWTKITFLNHYRWPDTEEGRRDAEEWRVEYTDYRPYHTVVIAVDRPASPTPDFMITTG